jgi:DNA-binding SARP family transcriptional activator/tetratricopeptide (TPR) repeat protein
MLELRLLGELEVRRDGRPLGLPPSKRSRALLGYLAATGKPHLRSYLCDLLWSSPGDPRAALRWSLAKIRPLFEPDAAACLLADREHVAFDSRGLALDLALAAECGLETASVDDLLRTSALFRGELLDGLELPDCHRYHQWCVAERERWRGRRAEVLRTLVARTSAEPERALVHARTWVGVDPLAEEAHVEVMRLLGALGRTREALKQYDACRQVLAGELSARPSERLEQARRALGATPVATVAVPVAAALPGPVALLGRERERALIAAHLADPAVPGLLFRGEAGIGKSRLLEELCAQTRAAGGRVLQGRAFEAEMVRPYGAWIDALRQAPLAELPAPLRVELATLLPELAEGVAPAAARNRLFDAVVGLLQALSTAGPVTVVLDDVHWLDEASAALLHYVARAVAGTRVRLGAGARPAELQENEPVGRIVRALAREGRLREAALEPLDADETRRLARALAPDVDGDRVFDESRGNPLFAAEVARALQHGGEALSQALGDVIGDRLLRLDPLARELLTWAGALGRPFDVAALSGLTGLSDAEVVASAESLTAHGVWRETGPLLDFVHDLVRRAAYRQTSSARRHLVHLRIARALDARPDPDGALAAEVAHHAALGGDDALSARACVRAGRRCQRLFAYAEAAELADRGRAHARVLPRAERLPVEAALLELYVHSRTSDDRASDVEGALQGLIEEARAAGLEETAQEALSTLGYLHWWRGEPGLAQQAMLQQEEMAHRADPEVAARSLAISARCLVHLDRDLTRAARLLQEAASLARTTGAELIDVPWARALLHAHAGEAETAVPLLDRVHSIARARGDRYAEWDSQVRAAMIELERGRPADALARCLGLADLVGRMGEGSEPAFTAAVAALARLLQGEPGADAVVEEALGELRAIDSKWMTAYVLTHLAALDLRAGRPARARERAEEALASAEQVGRAGEAAVARAVLAGVALAGGDRAAAARLRDEARIDDPRLSARAREAWREVAAALSDDNAADNDPHHAPGATLDPSGRPYGERAGGR